MVAIFSMVTKMYDTQQITCFVAIQLWYKREKLLIIWNHVMMTSEGTQGRGCHLDQNMAFEAMGKQSYATPSMISSPKYNPAFQ